jgi:hypothetical protein
VFEERSRFIEEVSESVSERRKGSKGISELFIE